jgi:hypothetical protein
MPKVYSVALVCSVLIAVLLRIFALLPPKDFGNRGREVKGKYRIEDVGRPGAGMPNTSDEYTSCTEVRIPDISATISGSGRKLKTAR